MEVRKYNLPTLPGLPELRAGVKKHSLLLEEGLPSSLKILIL
jgi:hypothetical protein